MTIMQTIDITGRAAEPHPTRTVRRMVHRVACIGLGVLLVLVALSAIGAVYQTVATQRDVRTYPPPGQLVDIGGYRLHIYCTGPEIGGPTLILNHGGGAFGAWDWSAIQPQLARFARVCSYDRAGYGWSDASPLPRTVDYETDELHTLLERAGIAGPYVLVAHSLGGYTARMYATRYPDKVAGMVLVDSVTEGQWTIPDIRKFNGQFGIVTAFCRATAPIGLWRLLGETGLFPYPVLAYASPDQRARLQAQTYRPAYCSMIEQETGLWNLEASAALVQATRRPLGELPLLILTAGSGYASEEWRQGWLAEQADLRSLSTRSEQRIVDDATHFNFAFDHSASVVDAVHDVLGMIVRPQ
jgi:pimeloyl-ACP methyl ester carboxylesterase